MWSLIAVEDIVCVAFGETFSVSKIVYFVSGVKLLETQKTLTGTSMFLYVVFIFIFIFSNSFSDACEFVSICFHFFSQFCFAACLPQSTAIWVVTSCVLVCALLRGVVVTKTVMVA